MAVNNQTNTNQRSLDDWLSRLDDLSPNELKRSVSYMKNLIEDVEKNNGCKISSYYKDILEALEEYAKVREKYDVFVRPIKLLYKVKWIYESLPEAVKRRYHLNLTKLEKNINGLVEKTKEHSKAKIESENKIYSIISKYPEVGEDLDIAIAQIATEDMLYTLLRDIRAILRMKMKLDGMDKDAKNRLLSDVLSYVFREGLREDLGLYRRFLDIYILLQAYHKYRLIQRCTSPEQASGNLL